MHDDVFHISRNSVPSALAELDHTLVVDACVVATFSREAILSLVLGFVVLAVATKRFRALLKSAVALVLFFVGMMIALGIIEGVVVVVATRTS